MINWSLKNLRPLLHGLAGHYTNLSRRLLIVDQSVAPSIRERPYGRRDLRCRRSGLSAGGIRDAAHLSAVGEGRVVQVLRPRRAELHRHGASTAHVGEQVAVETGPVWSELEDPVAHEVGEEVGVVVLVGPRAVVRHERATGYGLAIRVVVVLVDGSGVLAAVAVHPAAALRVVVAARTEVPPVIPAGIGDGIELVDLLPPGSSDVVDS